MWCLEQTRVRGWAPFTEASDRMGDGSLTLLPTPGHTAGSVSLLVRRAGRPPLLLVGDLTYGADILQRGQLPGAEPVKLNETSGGWFYLTGLLGLDGGARLVDPHFDGQGRGCRALAAEPVRAGGEGVV